MASKIVVLPFRFVAAVPGKLVGYLLDLLKGPCCLEARLVSSQVAYFFVVFTISLSICG